MKKAAEAGYRFPFTNHLRGAKRRAVAIEHCRGRDKRKKHYVQLLRFATATLRSAEAALQALEHVEVEYDLPAQHKRLADQLAAYIELGWRVVDQSRRRVLEGESVPAAEKVVSIFEPHTDIIRKDNRDTYYGHKVYLSVGRSSLVLDCVTEDGNPADATMVERAIRRLEEICGCVPEQAAFDGGFASKANVKRAKELGVKQICFSKRRGIAVSDMVSSSWMYCQLRRFRAGIEGCISFLKRGFGLSRCTWRGEKRFKSYVWASIVAHNLLVIARHSL
jgi:IS5 family transposase